MRDHEEQPIIQDLPTKPFMIEVEPTDIVGAITD
jgi:hypothetical protein